MGSTAWDRETRATLGLDAGIEGRRDCVRQVCGCRQPCQGQDNSREEGDTGGAQSADGEESGCGSLGSAEPARGRSLCFQHVISVLPQGTRSCLSCYSGKNMPLFSFSGTHSKNGHRSS